MLGFKDPVQGLVIEDMIKQSDFAFKGLVERGLIRGNRPDQFEIAPAVSKLVVGIHQPIHTVVCGIQREPTEPTTVCAYHYKFDSIVVLQELEKTKYKISKAESWDAIKQSLISPLGNKSSSVDDGTLMRISRSRLEEATLLVKDRKMNKAESLFHHADLDHKTITDFLTALGRAQVRMSMMVFYHRQSPQRQITKGFSVIAMTPRIWLLEQLGSQLDIVNVRQISKEKLEKRIENILPRLGAAS